MSDTRIPLKLAMLQQTEGMLQALLQNEQVTRRRVDLLEKQVRDLIEALRQLKVLPEPPPEEKPVETVATVEGAAGGGNNTVEGDSGQSPEGAPAHAPCFSSVRES